MRIKVSSKNIVITNALKERVENKLGKFDRYFAPDTEAHVMLNVEKDRHIIEVTIPFGNGVILRSEEATEDMYTSIDLLIEKMEKQIHKQKSRLEKKMKEASIRFDSYDSEVSYEQDSEIKVVRKKRFAIKPMNEEEAVMQMELLGHNFYVFQNADSDEVNVVYKRKQGNYGLIEPEF